jgi:hypothetical protein
LLLQFNDFFLNKNQPMKNSLETQTLVPLLVDARETLEPPASTQSKSKLIKQTKKKQVLVKA